MRSRIRHRRAMRRSPGRHRIGKDVGMQRPDHSSITNRPPLPRATVWLLLRAASLRPPPARLGRFRQLMRPTMKRCMAVRPRDWRLSPQWQQLILHQRSSLTARSSALRCRYMWIADEVFLGDALLPAVRTYRTNRQRRVRRNSASFSSMPSLP